MYLKRKWVRESWFWKQFTVNCISDFAFLLVNCFQSFSCAKKRHESNKSVEIVHELQFITTYYRNTNDVSTHAWPWLILHGPLTWHCKVMFVCLSFKTMSSKLDILASCQHQRMTIVISTSTVKVYLQVHLLWSKEGSTKVHYSYFIANYIQF